MEKRKALLRLLGLLVLSGTTIMAQTTAAISGTVTDSSGAVVAGANVVVVNNETGVSRVVETSADGHYSVLSLGLGTYRVTATHPGFQTEVRDGIVLTEGREAVVDLTAAVGAVSQTATVTAEAPLVDTTNASLGSLVDERTMRALPLNGRSYDQMVLIQPGVNKIDTGPLNGATFNFGSGVRFSVAGSRDIGNYFLLDGTNINDNANGTPGGAAGVNLGVDTILEVKIFTSDAPAEYGHSEGAVVSSITRSGTNAFHGTGFEYLRNSDLDARNFFDVGSSPPPFRRNQFGGVLGGPIKKDKLFFFGGYEGFRQGQASTQISTVPTVQAKEGILPTGTVQVNPAMVPYLNLYPNPNGPAFGDGTAEFIFAPLVVTNEDNLMGRVDYYLNEKNSIFARVVNDWDNLNDPTSIPNFFTLLQGRRQYYTTQWNTILGPQAVNNARIAFNRTNNYFNQLFTPDPGGDFVPGQGLGSITLGGISGGGSRQIVTLGQSGGTGYVQYVFNTIQFSDDFTYILGKHTLKMGGDLQRMRDNYAVTATIRGSYAFTSLATMLEGIPSQFQTSVPVGLPPSWGARQTLGGLYLQDEYRVTTRLTLNLGLRWEAVSDPTDAKGQMAILPSPLATSTVKAPYFFQTTKKDFGPRFGLAWKLTNSGKTVLRVGGGIFYNQILPWAYYQQLSLPPYYAKYSVTSNVVFPNEAALVGVGIPDVSGKYLIKSVSPVMKTPVADQYNVSLQQQLWKDTVLQVAYSGNHTNHQIIISELDPSVPVFGLLPNNQPYYPAGDPRINPQWAGEPTSQSVGNSDYNAGTVTVRHVSPQGFEGDIHYTWSKAMDQQSSLAPGDSVRSPADLLNPFNRAQDWGLSDYNQTSVLGFNFGYHLPFQTSQKALGFVVNGWTLNGIGTFASGEPFTARLAAAVSRDQDSQLSERPNLNPGFSPDPTSGVSAGCTGFAAGTPVGTPRHWYNPCAFSLPLAGTYGNVGRNTIIGPGIMDVDLALEKNFKHTERLNTTFRAEMFNIANHANFGLPNTSPLTSAGIANAAAGQITYTTTSSRQIEFAVRLSF